MECIKRVQIDRWIRFIIGGGLNTAVAYISYLALSHFLNYQLSFMIAYIIGIVFSYFFNVKTVFRATPSLKGFLTYPLVYVVQYAISALVLGIFVEKFGFSKILSPLLVSIITLPLTYLLSKHIIITNSIKNEAEINTTTMSSMLWILLFPPLVILVLIWLPFGTSMTGLIEEWGVLGLFNTSGLFYIVHLDGPLALHIMRPMTLFVAAIAYTLDENSFTFWHVLTFLALFIKSSAFTYLIAKVTRSNLLAIIGGSLLLVYPADTMQLSFRSLHINWSITLALCSFALCYAAFEAKSRSATYILITTAVVSYLLGASMYEATITLWILPLMLFLSKYGFRETLSIFKNKIGCLVLWVVAIGIHIGYIIWATLVASNYQSNVTGVYTGEGLLLVLFNALPKLFSVGVMRALLGGWIDAVSIVITEFDSYVYLIFSVVVIILIGFLLVRKSDHLTCLSSKTGVMTNSCPWSLILIGMIILMLGYAPFLLSAPHLVISQRTFIWATPGAVLVWLGFLCLLARFFKSIAVTTAVVLIICGLSAQLYQFHHYVNLSNMQRSFLKQIVEQFDGNLGNKTLIVLDETHTVGHTWMFRDIASDALSYIYGHPISRVEICHADSMEWQEKDGLARKGTCIKDDKGWVLSPAAPVRGPGYTFSLVVPYRKLSNDEVIVVKVNTSPITSKPLYIEANQRLLAERYRGILAPRLWPFALLLFKDQIVTDNYKWSFGNYWSLEIPTKGSGWREAEWHVSPFNQYATAWTIRDNAQLYFDFKPMLKSYRLDAKITDLAPSLSKEKIKFYLNGEVLNLRWSSNEIVYAEVPEYLLHNGENHIDISAPTDTNYFGLGLQMAWIKIGPQ